MTINFSVSVFDASGKFSSYFADITSNYLAAASMWGRYIAGSANIDAIINIVDTDVGTANGRSTTTGFFKEIDGIETYMQGATYEILTGQDPNGTGPSDYDIEINIDPDYLVNELWFDPNTTDDQRIVPNDRTDAVGVLMHEIGHAIGFNGWSDLYTGQLPGNYQSTFDQYITMIGGNPFFTGPNAVALYGSPIPLTYGNLHHYGNDPEPNGDLTSNGLMNGVYTTRGHTDQISQLDIEMMRDVGVPMVAGLTVAGTDSDETLQGASKADVLDGQGGDDNLYGQDGDDALYGGAGNDILYGGAGNDILNGGDGNDTLDGGDGNDTLNGGAGDDTYVVNSTKDIIIERAAEGTDTIRTALTSYTLGANLENLTYTGASSFIGIGNELANIIRGGTGSNTLMGGAGADFLYGNSGNDKLDGGIGADTMSGGAGNDTYTVDSSLDLVIEIGTGGSDSGGVDLVNSSATSYTLGAYVENLTLLAGAGNISGTGNGLANKITGNEAANTLIGGGGADILTGNAGADTLYGDAGADTLLGGADNDRLYGGADNDKLDGGLGADAMYGGAGNDTYTVDNIGDTVDESDDVAGVDLVNSAVSFTLSVNVENLTLTGTGAINGKGNDLANKLTGNSGANVLHGEAGNDTLSGGSGDDTLYGGAGNDKLDGGTGADAMHGGTGNDTYVVDSLGDTVDESDDATGVDSVSSSVSFALGLNVENLTLTGTAASNGSGNALANKIVGNAAANNLSGDAGNDILSGGAGKDILNGGAGLDTLTGGADADIFVFGPASSTSTDKVTDFSSKGGDRLQFNASDYGLITGQGLNSDGSLNSDYFEVVSGKTVIGTKGHAEFLFNITNKTLYWDADGIANGTQSKAPVAIASFTVPSSVAVSEFLHVSDVYVV